MNTLTGKSIGIALLLAAALVTALFAWSAFPAGADAHSITLNKSTAGPGDVITVTGSGFGTANEVDLYLLTTTGTNDSTSLGSAVAANVQAADGSFIGSFRIADITTAGSYRVYAATADDATVADSLASQPLTVKVVPTIRRFENTSDVTITSVNNGIENTVTVVMHGFTVGQADVVITVENSSGDAVGSGATYTAAITPSPFEQNISIPDATAVGDLTVKATQGSAMAKKTLTVIAPTITLMPESAENGMARTVTVVGSNFVVDDGDLNAVSEVALTVGGTPITLTGNDKPPRLTFSGNDDKTGFKLSGVPVTSVGDEPGKKTVEATVNTNYVAEKDFMLTKAAPAQVTGLTLAAGQGSLIATWTQVDAVNESDEQRPAATAYKVEWKTVSATTWAAGDSATVKGGAQVSYEIPNLDQNESYMVRISATADGATYGMTSAVNKDAIAMPGEPAPVQPDRISVSGPSTPADDSYCAGTDTGAMTFTVMPIAEVMDNRSRIDVALYDGFNGLELKSQIKVEQWNDTTKAWEDRGDVRLLDQEMYKGQFVIIPDASATDANPNVMDAETRVTISGLTTPNEAGWVRPLQVWQFDDAADRWTSDGSSEIFIRCAVISSDTPGAPVSVEIGTDADWNKSIVGGRHEIAVSLPGFGVPAEISENEVIISAEQGTVQRGNRNQFNGSPLQVRVAASTIYLTPPFTYDRGADQGVEDVEIVNEYVVIFKQDAGITNPTAKGEKTITVSDRDNVAHKMTVNIKSKVQVPAPGWFSRGKMVTITGVGLAAGTATVHLDDPNTTGVTADSDDFVLGRGPVTDGKVEVEVDTSTRQLVVGTGVTPIRTPSEGSAKGLNTIIIYDATGHKAQVDGVLGIAPTATFDVSDVKRSGLMEITVDDWFYGTISQVTVGGIPVDQILVRGSRVAWPSAGIAAGGARTIFTVVVPTPSRLGVQRVVITGSYYNQQGDHMKVDAHTEDVNVGSFDLTLRPTTAVSDQVIRIEGSGFARSVCITEIKVGDEDILQATTGDRVLVGSNTANCVTTDTNGTLANSFKVPLNLEPDTYQVVVRDSSNRVGAALLTVPEPEIMLDPPASQRGSTVTVEGMGFPAGDVITISYGRNPITGEPQTVTVATTDTVGKWRQTFKVPVDATIGAEYEVIAKSDVKADGIATRVELKAKSVHKVPEEILTVSPEAISSGQRLDVAASNLPLFTKVSLWVGGIAVAGRVLGEDAASDGQGRYTDSVLVPQLTPGTHNVRLEVHTVGSDVTVVTFVEILDIVTRPTDEVFEDVIAAGQLLVVWRYDNATATWASYDPSAPAELNDLNLVSTGDIVWVEVTENVAFQGQTLRAGWQLISLE